MKKHLILLLSLSAVSPVVYGMENAAAPVAPAQAAVQAPALPAAPVVAPAPAVAPQHLDPAATFVPQTDPAGTVVTPTTAVPALPAAPTAIAAAPVVAPTPAAAPAPATPAVQEPGRMRKAWNAVRSGTSTVVCAPAKGITWAWGKIKKAPATTKELASRMLARMLNVIWGQAPAVRPVEFAYHQAAAAVNADQARINDLTQAMVNQGRAVNNARGYQLKRAFGFGTIAAAIGTGLAYRKFGATAKTAITGLGSGVLSGIGSWFYLGKRTQLGEIARRHKASVLLATAAGVTDEQATEAHTASLNPGADDHRRLYALREFGLGRSDMSSMREEVAANYLTLHPTAVADREAARAAREAARTAAAAPVAPVAATAAAH